MIDNYSRKLQKFQPNPTNKRMVCEKKYTIKPKYLYPEGPKIGIVVGTYGSIPYIKLRLEIWKRSYKEIPTIIHDDYSPEGPELKKLCKDYGCKFVSTPFRYGWCPGDVMALVNGLKWASKNNYDILVKFSRRFIPIKTWHKDLQKFAYKSQFPTFSNICIHSRFGFRTECYAISVKSWLPYIDSIEKDAMARIGKRFFVEHHIHHYARRIYDYYNYKEAREFAIRYPLMVKGCFAKWDFMYNSRKARNNSWIFKAQGIKTYMDMAQKLGINWE